MKPSIGRIVHFVDHPNLHERGQETVHRPAVVLRAKGHAADLLAFSGRDSGVLHPDVPFDEDAAVLTWHWSEPEDVDLNALVTESADAKAGE
jgi:hypothetical protein